MGHSPPGACGSNLPAMKAYDPLYESATADDGFSLPALPSSSLLNLLFCHGGRSKHGGREGLRPEVDRLWKSHPESHLAACVLFLWDYFLTFDLEVQHIWKAKWNVIKVVYLLQRYLPFFDSCYLGLYREFSPRSWFDPSHSLANHTL
ncbi:hypothetical protein D9619_004753 [Psilocybe cf. subviscida]|uniref:DUF6533 domain-containing protein n=1 Tax=Psilocybe cf. subviscida TaxID=2480587 RepID=A0A8H5BQP2_9AGAR|nr:hypothetical protein D9619_004753 [Psilocybe cf. subviscida]